METLACMSARTCPSCWHFAAGRCGLMAQVRDAVPPAPMVAHGPFLGLASA